MLQHQTTYLIALLTAAAVDGALFHVAWLRRPAGGHGFAVLMAAAFLYSAGYAGTLVSATAAARIWWAALEYLGLAAAAPAWVMTAAGTVKRGRFLTRRLAVTLCFIPAASLLLYYTNGYHHLYYGAVSMAPPGPLALISHTRGPWYWVFAVYVLASLLLGNVLYAGKRRRERGAARRQAGALLAASLVPWAAVLAYFPGERILDPGPLALSVTGLAFGWIFLRRDSPAVITRDSVFQGIREGVLVLDTQNRIVDFNSAARTVIAGLAPQALGRPVKEVLHDQPELLRQLVAPECDQTELQLPLGRGLRCYQSRLSILENRRHQVIGKAVILCDVTRETWRVDELQARARMDALTGIFNRRYLLELGHRELERARPGGRPFSVVLIDIDHFKDVNDTYGHSAGDLVLKSVVRTCAGALRSRDLMGRWGGEEFVLILPGASPDGALAVAERARKNIAGSVVSLDNTTTVSVTASFGVAGVAAPESGTSLEKLLEMADQALYRAKNSGRNRVVLSRD